MSTPSPSPYTPRSPEEILILPAIENLAQRLNIGSDEIEVVEFKSVVWRDGSLGCPQPGMAYPQVLSDGYYVRLSAQGNVYQYHGDGIREPFLCENPEKPFEVLPDAGIGNQ